MGGVVYICSGEDSNCCPSGKVNRSEYFSEALILKSFGGIKPPVFCSTRLNSLLDIVEIIEAFTEEIGLVNVLPSLKLEYWILIVSGFA